MKKWIAMLALCIASTGVMAQTAQAAPQPMAASPRMERMMQELQQRFAVANTTHDGKLTLAQAQTGMPRVAQYFNEIDTQKQGYVTLGQIEQFMAQRAGSH
ncbi:EF-hand domain-containing protein [Paraburkholderia phymatum]|uniref:EF-hand domain-containing protein n=1 Tax=Paraburkholderia phymatum TaxID=148447 RepID=A0ACC6TVC2_9BURK